MAFRVVVVILVCFTLIGCEGTIYRAINWSDDLVNVLIIMNENGDCDVVYDGMRSTQNYTTELNHRVYENGGRYLELGCRTDPYELSDKNTFAVGFGVITEHAPYIDTLIDSSSEGVKIIEVLYFYPITHMFSVYGKKSGQSYFCTVRITFKTLSIVANVGIDGKRHIAIGSGKRSCS